MALSIRASTVEPVVLPLAAIVVALLIFAVFIAVQGQSAAQALHLLYLVAYGSSFSWQNTLLRASPLMLTALCVALPARAGMVIIGGEGALALGGLAAAVVPMAVMRELGVSHDKLNVHGGACALGHPIGASGARIVVTLLNALTARGAKKGVAALCIGGGEATAVAIELV